MNLFAVFVFSAVVFLCNLIREQTHASVKCRLEIQAEFYFLLIKHRQRQYGGYRTVREAKLDDSSSAGTVPPLPVLYDIYIFTDYITDSPQ